MKKSELGEIKKMETKALIEKIKQAKKELVDLKFDQNLGKLKDKKQVYKKRKDIAQMMTILKQKEMLEQLESRIKPPKASLAESGNDESSEKVMEQKKASSN